MKTLAQTSPSRVSTDPARTAFRTLLVHVQPETRARSHLQTAAHLARKLDATLLGIGAEMIDPITFTGGFGAGVQLSGELEDAMQASLKHSEAAFQFAAQGLDSHWVAVEQEPLIAVAAMAREADLIVAGGLNESTSGAYRCCDPGQLALTTGRPVLVTPERGGQLEAEAIVVAWKDTREARRALADSMPFLRSAYEVLVMEVCSKSEFREAEARTASVADGLTRHGVNAQHRVMIAPQSKVVEELNAAAAAIGADLIVAGGYGHSRMGEWILGGVTRDLLRQSKRFVLLSH